VITSRRVGKAVLRNRARRIMREIFRKNLEVIPRSADIVIIMRHTYTRETYSSLEARFLKAVHRMRKTLEIEFDPRGEEG